MKKTARNLVVVLAAMFAVGCVTAPYDVSDIPDWYLNPPVAEDAVYGLGDAQLSTLSLSRITAVSRARDDIARQVEVTVKNAITDYAQEAGVDGQKQTIEFVETISRQIADITLRGAKIEKTHAAKDGTNYAMVSYGHDAFKESAVAEFKRNESSTFAEFKAETALEKLNSELENSPPKAGSN